MSNDINELMADVREQVLYMQELGVTGLDAELALQTAAPAREVLRSVAASPEIPNLRSEISDRKPEVPKPVERPVAGSRLASLPSLSSRPKNAFFDKYNPQETTENPKVEIGIPVAVPVPEINPVVQSPVTEIFEILTAMPEPTETIEQIRAEIGPDCVRCKLSTLGRSKVVNSVGNFNADLMFVGEAPGADEDAQGEPFVGRAGQLLTDIIKAMGYGRSDVFIGNINRCRQPDNRAPTPDESVVCKPF
ncbi:MAG: uracil-DNA glycosylase, partial [Pyrinomonadaceae bacterium]